MSHNVSSLFSALSTGQAGTWKPVRATAGKSKSLVATAFSTPSAEAADSVDVSPLSKALTGTAAKIFEKLDGKARGMLEESVKAGVLTADDVVKGLRGIAKEAVERRYYREAPRTQEEIEFGEKMRSINERKMKFGTENMEIIDSFSKKMEQVEKESSGEELYARKDAIFKQMTAAITEHKKNFTERYGDVDEKVMKDGKEVDENFMMRRLSNNLRNSDLFFGEEDSSIYSKSDSKAVEKLFNAGFRPSVYGNAAKAFAAEADLSKIPDLDRPEAEPQPKQASADKQPPGYSDGKTQLDSAWQAVAGMMMLAKKAEDDPMVVMLRSNANATFTRQGNPALQPLPAASQSAADSTTAAADNEAALGALNRLLKAAVASPTGVARTDTKV